MDRFWADMDRCLMAHGSDPEKHGLPFNTRQLFAKTEHPLKNLTILLGIY